MSIEHTPELTTVAMKTAVLAERTGIGIATTAGATKLLGLTPDQWAIVGVIAGIVIGGIGLVAKLWMDWYFRSQHLKLAEKRTRALAGGESVPGGLE